MRPEAPHDNWNPDAERLMNEVESLASEELARLFDFIPRSYEDSKPITLYRKSWRRHAR